jgi:hypothetical protein
MELNWANRTRLVIHVGDAPCHGSGFHNMADDYPSGYSGDMPWRELFAAFVAAGIDYIFAKINNETDKMISNFKEIWHNVA